MVPRQRPPCRAAWSAREVAGWLRAGDIKTGPYALVSTEDQASLLGLLKKHKTGRFCKTTLSARLIHSGVAEKACRLADLRALLPMRRSNQGIRTPPRNCSSTMISGTVARSFVPESPSFGPRVAKFRYATCRIRVHHLSNSGTRFESISAETGTRFLAIRRPVSRLRGAAMVASTAFN